MSIPALSVRAPWAWAIAHAGKRIENRTWRTTYRGPLYIHASMGATQVESDQIERLCGTRPPPDMERGAIVATACLTDVRLLSEVKGNRWAAGPWCWILEDVLLIAPRPAKGRLGLWLPEERIAMSR